MRVVHDMAGWRGVLGVHSRVGGFFFIYLTNPIALSRADSTGWPWCGLRGCGTFQWWGKKCVALIKSDAAVVAECNYERCVASRFIPHLSSCCLLPAAAYFFCFTAYRALFFYFGNAQLHCDDFSVITRSRWRQNFNKIGARNQHIELL